jgi:hypothetical protein
MTPDPILHPLEGVKNMTIISQKEIGYLKRRVRNIGVPRTISLPILSLVLKWVSLSGAEWTVGRLKQIKNDFLRKKAGMDPVSVWIKKSSSRSRIFGGPFGLLESWAFSSDIHFRKTLNLLNIYTSFFSSSVTLKQGKKFFSGVTASAVAIPPSIQQFIGRGISLSGLRKIPLWSLSKPQLLLSYVPSPSKRAPLPSGSVPEIEGVIDSVRYLGMTPSNAYHYHKYQDFYDPILKGLEPEMAIVQRDYDWGKRNLPQPFFNPDSFYVGRLAFIQEPGFKLRAVANPGRIFQMVLKPLGDALYSILQDLPWDCTFEQSKADAVIMHRLAAGDRVYSVDLTGATDYFPLELQRQVLVELLPDTRLVDLFCEISRGQWSIPKGIDQTLIKTYCKDHYHVSWTKGQPLGLYPSFASFALTHGILLLGLLDQPWDEDFFILGDDVVILDDDLYDRYMMALHDLGCPVSQDKTIVSNNIAEFRSIIYMADSKIPQFKWRATSDDSFVDLSRNDPSLINLLLPRQKAVIDIISGLPEYLGGLGLNPNGLPLSVRLEPFKSLLVQDYVPRDRLMSYTSLVQKLLFSSKLSDSALRFITPERSDVISILDQRIWKLVFKVFPGYLYPLRTILGKNLDLVLEGDLNLPSPSFEPSRLTMLNRWESTLRDLNLLSKAG